MSSRTEQYLKATKERRRPPAPDAPAMTSPLTSPLTSPAVTLSRHHRTAARLALSPSQLDASLWASEQRVSAVRRRRWKRGVPQGNDGGGRQGAYKSAREPHRVRTGFPQGARGRSDSRPPGVQEGGAGCKGGGLAGVQDVSAARGPMGCEGGAPRVQGWVRWCAKVESHGVWGGVPAMGRGRVVRYRTRRSLVVLRP